MRGGKGVMTRGWLGAVSFAGALVVHAGAAPMVQNGTGPSAWAGLVWTLGATARAEIGAGCAAGERCGAGEVCRVGLCMEACLGDAACLEGMYCLDGACVPDAVACLETAHCADMGGERVCHEGMCLLPQCDSDAACAPGWVCVGQVCEDPNAPDVVPGTDVVSLKQRLREQYLGCGAAGEGGGGLGLTMGLAVLLWLGWAGRQRGAGAP